ncbi:hypothetical protein NC651_038214 [Populus alba x Populus x berolinensis]|nr:hypothetical protein NC651_038214 [Populus alba x Populus x berolinensis]
MSVSGVLPDEITMVFTEKNEVDMDAMLGTALLDNMYGKCRCVDMACEIFSQIIYQNVFVWTATYDSSIFHGGACPGSNKPLVAMEVWFIKLQVFQQIGCMVGLLGRVGNSEETVKFIERMPAEPEALYGVP